MHTIETCKRLDDHQINYQILILYYIRNLLHHRTSITERYKYDNNFKNLFVFGSVI